MSKKITAQGLKIITQKIYFANSGALTVGDFVMWRGTWGKDAPVKAKVTRIEKIKDKNSRGENVHSAQWDDMEHITVELDNGHWAYGNQISKLER